MRGIQRVDTLERSWEPKAIEAIVRELPGRIDEASTEGGLPHVAAWIVGRLSLAKLADLNCDPVKYGPAVQSAVDAWAGGRGVEVPSLNLPDLPDVGATSDA